MSTDSIACTSGKVLMKMDDFDVCNKKKPMNITIKGKNATFLTFK